MNKLSPFYFPYAQYEFIKWAPLTMEAVVGVYPDVIKEDVIYSNVKLNSEHITVIGGGSSSLTLKDVPACVWTMNGFYKTDKKCNLISVGGSVNPHDHNLLRYINKYKCQVAFEIHPKWHQQKLPATCYYHTKIYGQIGVGARLINLAAALGAKQIDFIGLDGPLAILKGHHAFEPGKTELPSMCTKETAHQIHLDQYRFFWQYIRELYPNTIFNSLDKNNEYHNI
ncbi:MAG: hypothetical protein KBD25_01235 [Rickettsiaceae bacterium]|nr:hypothetical protein [Rickettsiaceae bacterium]